MIKNRREILIGSLAFAAGALATATLTLLSSDTKFDRIFSDIHQTAIDEFQAGHYAMFHGVVVSPTEMKLVATRLQHDPESLPDGAAVLDLLVPNTLE